MLSVSLIITTYNWPKALYKVLQSILYQTRIPDEIIIADDGSTIETTNMIQRFKEEHSELNIIHFWQEDKGFRLSKSRNKAINLSTCDYLVLIDGDMILNENFILDHLNNAKSGVLVSGRRIMLNEAYSSEIIHSDKIDNVSFLSSAIIKHRFLSIRNRFLSKLRSSTNTRIDGILGCNMAFFKNDAVTVNGFNEDFVGWGAEDTEFVARFVNNGFKKMKLKHLAFGYHLYHPESSKEMVEANCNILDLTISMKLKYCQHGLAEY
ncbi:glycosyl transferase family 2 [Shewanella sp. NFH-SH190041]|uniref:glycosyltransferase family 2 protein n=1 Tax=Shewanella sp. NFH-SH190041 TaxID=2950245 RepID=UPI0021C2C0D8|nr:glycosyltransferase family 2 protein [Shewanella sp. NFH-SH190041]BDM62997.1 glycosyl transferase family 2 [Shewanella sp. NFH-SH190041]